MKQSLKPTRIILHGKLRRLHPHPIEIFGNTVAELITGVTRQIKSFHPAPGTPRLFIKVRGFDTAESLYRPLDTDEIHLHPAFAGGKNGGLFKIVLGVALVAITVASGGIGAAGFLGTVASMGFGMGASMLLSGLMELMSPSPKMDTTSDAEASKYLGAPQNTVRIGTRIPLLFGRHKAYGHYLSFNINAEDVNHAAQG